MMITKENHHREGGLATLKLRSFKEKLKKNLSCTLFFNTLLSDHEYYYSSPMGIMRTHERPSPSWFG